MRILKKSVSILLSALMVVSLLTVIPFAAGAESAVPELTDGAYVPNQVVVLFKDSAIDTETTSGKGELEPLGADFGDMMDASSSETEAFSAADEEVDILSKSLGGDFVLEDTLVFDEPETEGGKNAAPLGALGGASFSEGLTVALVSSDRYDTATLIQKLSGNKNVAKVEPNYISYSTALDDYSLNDEYSSYLYHVNSPAAENKGGDSVDDRGADAETALSTNAASGWKKVTDTEKEVVVAVVDTGVLDTHEDLKDVMWTNPGNLGLKGEHGYNFFDNKNNTKDIIGHGTHCAGVIAAQANNLKGVAGIASAVNVKIMALQILNGERDTPSAYCFYGAYNYIHKAAQGGVNVVAVNNSWGGSNYGTIYDDILNVLGEDGIVNYIASGNESSDADRLNKFPANSESEYVITVGAADITGKSANFSNYGKASVDIFGPGVNVLSSVSYKTYFPTLYDRDRFNAVTDYYGEFNADTKVTDGTITPSTGSKADESVKAFGSLKFVKQSVSDGEQEGDPELSEASLELSVENGRHLTTGNPYRLKLTVKNARYGEEYFIYFPYEKNPLTTGGDNTAFSIAGECVGCKTGSTVSFLCGEVFGDDDGRLALSGVASGESEGVKFCSTSMSHEGIVRHKSNLNEKNGESLLLSAEEANGRELGLGIYVKPDWGGEDTHDLSVCLDSIALTKPGVEFDANTSYDIMSGTSMACPAVCGAGALVAALNPRMDGEPGADYTKRIRHAVLSCARQTDELKNICSTGGYVDLSLLDGGAPVISDAVCDLDNKTVTLTGANLFGELTYRNLRSDDAEDKSFSDAVQLEYSEDGSSIVIRNAESLFSTYTAFTVTNDSGLWGEGKFFLVKGQKQLDYVSSYMKPQPENLYPPQLVSDAEGGKLFGYFWDKNEVAEFNGKQFNIIDGSNINNALNKYFAEETGDYYSAYNDYEVSTFITNNLLNEKGVIYTFGLITPYEDGEEASEDSSGERWYLCSFDLNEEDPAWSFCELDSVPDEMSGGSLISYSVVMNGKIYAVTLPEHVGNEPQTFMLTYSFDLKTKEWTREADLPANMTGFTLTQSNGGVYVIGGFVPDPEKPGSDIALKSVYCFDGKKWEQKKDIELVGRYGEFLGGHFRFDVTSDVKNGMLIINSSVDGGGNVSLYHTDTEEIEPLYYTVGDALSEAHSIDHSCAVTRDGVYYIRQISDDYSQGWELLLLPESSGAYETPYFTPILGDVDGDGEVTVADVTRIQKYLAGYEMPYGFNLEAADADGDGNVTVADATQIQRFLAGMPSSFGIGEPVGQTDPLSLWTQTAPLKAELTDYMKAITDVNSPDYIPVENRIAVFDMDGTLCCETDPGYFDHKLLYHRVMEDPDYKDKASDFEKEVCAEIETYFETGVYPKGLDVRHGTAVATAFKGMTMAEFEAYVKAYRDTPMNSYTNMTNGQAFYKPMLQVVDFLQANGFKVYIVSGTDRFITRGLADGMINIPLAQMIGSDESLVATGQGDADGLNYTFTHDDELITGGEFIIKNLKMNKVTVIEQEIGLQPVLCFGNSSGDAAMANYTITNNKYRSGAFLLCCDDLERENGNLKKANDMRASCEKNGWTAVSMKDDWTTIYGDGVEKK